MTTLSTIETTLNEITSSFEELFEESIDLVTLEGKTLKEALNTQLPLQLQLEVMYRKLSYLYDEVEMMMEESYGEAIKKEMSNSYRDINLTEAKSYAYANPTYKANRKMLNKVRHVRDECKGCLEVINSRKFTLNNMTNSIVANVEKTIL